MISPAATWLRFTSTDRIGVVVLAGEKMSSGRFFAIPGLYFTIACSICSVCLCVGCLPASCVAIFFSVSFSRTRYCFVFGLLPGSVVGFEGFSRLTILIWICHTLFNDTA